MLWFWAVWTDVGAVVWQTFKGRETAAEGKAVADHEKMLLERLKAKLRAEQGADGKEHVRVIEKLEEAIHEIKLPEKAVAAARNDPLTAEDFLRLRQELMNKVRDLEDELARLKISQKQ